MEFSSDTIIGIVGGMGPKAGLDLLNSILCQTEANTDQEHLSAILMSFPKHITDRTAFLQGDTPVNPAFCIVEVIKKLETAGAKIIGMACNTAHAPEIYDVIQHELEHIDSKVLLINMPFETCRYIKENYPNARRIGLLTTNGTYKKGIYSNLLKREGYEVVVPDEHFQNNIIHKMIYDTGFGLKSNPETISDQVKLLIGKALNFYKERETDLVILGCTELTFAFPSDKVEEMVIIDSTKMLAKALIREAIKQGK